MEERDPALSAVADWQAVRSVGNGSVGSGTEEVKSGSSCEEQSDFELEADGSLPFYIIDVHEEVFGANMGTLYLFGKVYVMILKYKKYLIFRNFAYYLD